MRDWNVGDYWLVEFINEKNQPKDEDGEYYQLGLNLEMDDWEPEEQLEACGFGAATWEGAELFNCLTLDQFVQKLKELPWD